MHNQTNERERVRINNFKSSLDSFETTLTNIQNVWTKSLDSLENSLVTMREELFRDEQQQVSITGQILIESGAERASKILRETSNHHKTLHLIVSKIGRSVARSFNSRTMGTLQNEFTPEILQYSRQLFVSMIYDFLMTDGFNASGVAMKKECQLHDKYDVDDPETLKQIVDDLREGEISSSLDFLELTHPTEEKELRRELQTQMITDCIEQEIAGKETYDRGIKLLRRYRTPYGDERAMSMRLIGALLIGNEAMYDRRYRDLFDYSTREQLTLKMTAFFIPHEAPLKNILRYGVRTVSQICELGCTSYGSTYIIQNELPFQVAYNGSHSVFTCPILKEQCCGDNPPMRLFCGHVVSRDAISRLSTNVRQVRSSARHARFKCPYCPREQYMDTARKVDFNKWREKTQSMEELMILQLFS